MSAVITVLVGAGLAGLGGFSLFSGIKLRRARRERFIRQFVLPQGLFKKLQEKRPEIDARHHSLVARALRQFFLCHLLSGRKFVSMPSQVVDDLWHEFILYTRNYQLFCNKAFGGYMHHSPAVQLGHGQSDDVGLKRVWRYACLEENINPKDPRRLPLLFAIDAKLGIADGFRYTPNCTKESSAAPGNTHCGAALGCGGGSCGGGSAGSWGDSWFGSDSGGGFFDIGGGSADSGGSSCGGGGCGGGSD